MTRGLGLEAWDLGPGGDGEVPQSGPTAPDPQSPTSPGPSPTSPGPPVPTSPIADVVVPASCEVGAHCVVSVRVDCPAEAQCDLDAPGRLGAFEVLQVSQPGLAATAGSSSEWRLTLVAFEPGEVDLPQLTVRVVRTGDGTTSIVATRPARVDVQLAAGEDAAPLRPDAPPLDPGPDWRMVGLWVVLGLCALGVAALAWRWWRRRSARRPPTMPQVTAARAIAVIRALAQTPAGGPDEVLARYRGLSDALRGYLGLPLEVPVSALTSSELVRAIDDVRLRAAPSRARERHERTRRLLVDVDEVKFGGARPDETTRAEHCRRAIELIEEMEATRPGPRSGGGRVA